MTDTQKEDKKKKKGKKSPLCIDFSWWQLHMDAGEI